MVLLLVCVKGEDPDLVTGDSSLHCSYNHAYGYASHPTPYHGYSYAEDHHHAATYDYAPAYGYGHPPAPLHHGFVPLHHGHDLVGPLYHHSGPFGPFGFYANFYHG